MPPEGRTLGGAPLRQSTGSAQAGVGAADEVDEDELVDEVDEEPVAEEEALPLLEPESADFFSPRLSVR
jgi:hypothetical protein